MYPYKTSAPRRATAREIEEAELAAFDSDALCFGPVMEVRGLNQEQNRMARWRRAMRIYDMAVGVIRRTRGPDEQIRALSAMNIARPPQRVYDILARRLAGQ